MTTNTENVETYTADETQVKLVKYLLHNVNYWNDVFAQKGRDAPKGWIETVGGVMHSTHVGMAGNAGGFDGSIDLMLTQQGSDQSYDVNDGALQYTFVEHADIDALNEEIESKQNDTDPTEMLRLVWHRKLATIAHGLKDSDMPDSMKTLAFMRALLDFIERGDEDIARIDLVMSTMEEDKEYWIELGQRYTEDGTPLNHLPKSLVEVWDELLKSYNI